MRKFYLTTPVYYVNDIPHIGHAYTTVAADTLVRYKRLSGYDVFFLTGTDEHGNKILQTAQKNNLTPIELSDKMSANFKKLWGKLHISYDDFIRTTQTRHTQVVKKIFLKLYEKGDIYKGKYEGWYCIPCESFWLESQLKEGKLCPECGGKVEKIKEESYFFKLSRYQKPLLAYFKAHPNFVLPSTRMNEVVEFVKRGLNDLSVTRLNLKWGIPCPIDDNHTIYVWIDALINYISALGYLKNNFRFSKFWPADVQLVGKDILKFHAIIWPALLMALGLELPRMIFAHGWWKIKGEKMSKSKKNVVDPLKLAEDYGADCLRYFLLREVPFGEDGNFSYSLFIKRINSDLSNDLGNLLNRVLPLVVRYCGGKIPSPSKEGEEDKKLREKIDNLFPSLEKSMETLSFSDALSKIWEIVRGGNLYVDKCAPWQLAKKEGKKARLNTVLYNSLEVFRILSILLFPFIPKSAEKMWAQLGLQENLNLQSLKKAKIWGQLSPGILVQKGSPLFPRIKEDF